MLQVNGPPLFVLLRCSCLYIVGKLIAKERYLQCIGARGRSR